MTTAFRITPAAFLAGVVVAASSLSSAPALAAPAFQLPVPCGQVWSGQTRSNHSPVRSIDFNRTDDYGDPVVASAAGTVSTVRNLGSTSYGKYVVINHGGGWTSYYAHLNSFSVSVGQSVARGRQIGTVGSTGGSTGPHLHFEQRYNGSPVWPKFNGSTVYYYGTRNYSSANCGGGTATGTVNTSGANLNVRSGPSTNYSIVGSLADGTQVTIYCQIAGQSITGTYGTSNLCNRIGSGRYIPDAYTYTGTDGRVAPNC